MPEDKPIVYVETSVISYYTAKPSNNVITLGHQQITWQWWEHFEKTCTPVISVVVHAEIRAGDPEMAEKRLAAVAGWPILRADDSTEELTLAYRHQNRLPLKAERDAAHIAIATVYAVDYLVTWNCRHIANGFIRKWIEKTNAARGFSTPLICTPQELLHDRPE